jgi:uncharacterized protein (DUF2267 family)
MYEFAWPSPQMGGRLGAAHAVEIPFVFDTLGLGTEPMLGRDPPQSLADEMHRAWVSFAARGDCGWPRYEPAQRRTMRFAATSAVVNDPLGQRLALWERPARKTRRHGRESTDKGTRMSGTHVPIFDKTVEKTNTWLARIGGSMVWEDPHKSYMALRGVLHALRDRLPPTEAVQLAAQLPMLIRGFYYEGWHPADKPEKYRHKKQFLHRVVEEAPWLEEDDIERVITTVFEILSSELGDGETNQVRADLPPEIRELWPRPRM